MTMHFHRLGRSLRERREQLGMSQRRLAEKVGIRHTHVSRVERGESGVSLAVLTKLADVLQVPSHWLIGSEQMDVPAPRISKDEINSDESMLVSLFRNLPKSDQRFLLRWAAALVHDTKFPPNSRGLNEDVSDESVSGRPMGKWHPVLKAPCAESLATTNDLSSSAAFLTARVSGDDLAEFGLLAGDLVALTEKTPQPGDLVVATVDMGEQVSREWKSVSSSMVELAASAGQKTLLVEQSRIDVHGVITHVWR